MLKSYTDFILRRRQWSTDTKYSPCIFSFFLTVSPDFGFGLLNVGRMVELAGQWKDLLKSGNNVPDAELCYIKIENTM